jgi:hypothetical protein
MNKPLKLWNGCVFMNSKQTHICLAAKTKADAIRLCGEFDIHVTNTEISNYWSGCWGNNMKGIEPKRAIWVERDRQMVELLPEEVDNGKP